MLMVVSSPEYCLQGCIFIHNRKRAHCFSLSKASVLRFRLAVRVDIYPLCAYSLYVYRLQMPAISRLLLCSQNIYWIGNLLVPAS